MLLNLMIILDYGLEIRCRFVIEVGKIGFELIRNVKTNNHFFVGINIVSPLDIVFGVSFSRVG